MLLSSHILVRGRGALRPGHASSATGRTVETGTLAELRHLTRTVDQRRAGRRRPHGLAALPGVHDLQRRRRPGALRRRHRRARRGAAASSPTVGVRSLVSQPPTLEELFLRHYEAPEPVAGAAVSAFTGTGRSPGWSLRRDRVLLPVWVLLLAVLPVTGAAATAALYPTDAARAGLHRRPRLVGRAHRASTGRLAGAEPRRPGRLAVPRLRAVIVGADRAVLTVVRHTRAEEEAGRRELLGAGRRRPARRPGRRPARRARARAWSSALLVALGHDRPAPAGRRLAARWAWRWASAGDRLFAAVGGGRPPSSPAAPARPAGSAIAVARRGVRAARVAGDVSARQRPAPGCPGCRRSAGRYHVRPYAGDRWWVLALVVAPHGRARAAARSRCRPAGTSAPGCCRRAPARRRGAGPARPARAGLAAAPRVAGRLAGGLRGARGLLFGGVAQTVGRPGRGQRGAARSHRSGMGGAAGGDRRVPGRDCSASAAIAAAATPSRPRCGCARRRAAPAQRAAAGHARSGGCAGRRATWCSPCSARPSRSLAGGLTAGLAYGATSRATSAGGAARAGRRAGAAARGLGARGAHGGASSACCPVRRPSAGRRWRCACCSGRSARRCS